MDKIESHMQGKQSRRQKQTLNECGFEQGEPSWLDFEHGEIEWKASEIWPIRDDEHTFGDEENNRNGKK